MGFNGYFEHSLDAKHRLSIPARFRAAYSSGLVLSQDPDACISIWTPDVHQATVSLALQGKNPLTSEYKKLQRYFHGHSFDLELDSAGRVTLPPPLLSHARIDKEVVVVGLGDHLEIWGREHWHEQQRALNAGIEEVTEALGNAS